MRFSLTSGPLPILCTGAIAVLSAVSAAVLPSHNLRRAEQTFQTMSPEEIAAGAANSSTPFDLSKVKDSKSAGRLSNAPTAGGDDGDSCVNPTVRTEWRAMGDADKTSFVEAVRCLMDKPASGTMAGAGNRYEDLVAVHKYMTNSIHGVAQFLPFHRYFLGIFHDMLRAECAYTGPLPWWDETLDAGHFSEAPMFTAEYFGSAPLKSQDTDGQGTCITDGAFANITLHLGGERCLSRSVNEDFTINTNAEIVNKCNSVAIYSSMEICSDTGAHAWGHNGIGAVMSQVETSPADPIFFLHHGFVDHNWRLWQIYDPDTRVYQINGCSDKVKPCTPITSDYVLESMGLRPSVTITDVMDTKGGYFCYVYDY